MTDRFSSLNPPWLTIAMAVIIFLPAVMVGAYLGGQLVWMNTRDALRGWWVLRHE